MVGQQAANDVLVLAPADTFGVIVLADGDAEELESLLRRREMMRVGIDQRAVEIEQKGAQAAKLSEIRRQ